MIDLDHSQIESQRGWVRVRINRHFLSTNSQGYRKIFHRVYILLKIISGAVDNSLQIERFLGGCLICGSALMRVDSIKLVRRVKFVQSLLFS